MSEPDAWDPIVDRVREIKMRFSEEFQHDPARISEHLVELERQFRGRFVPADKRELPEDGKSAA